MGKIKSLIKKQIHQRDIRASSFEVDETSIVIEGVLKDKALESLYKFTGEKTPPSVYHHMVVRWLVEGPQMRITDLEVEMPTVPNEECHKAEDLLKNIIGVEIVSSFTKNISSLFGGIKGCAHIKSLLLLMGTTAIQGYWCLVTRDKQKMERHAGMLVNAVKDTCYVWRQDGDAFKAHGGDSGGQKKY